MRDWRHVDRRPPGSPPVIYAFGDHEIDLAVHEVRRGGAPVPVEPQVFDVLVHLVANRDRTVTKEDLLDAVWGDRFVSESALTSRIKAARRAVGDDGRAQAVIRTVHGRGYRFVAEVDERAPGAASPPTRPTGGGGPVQPSSSPRPPRTRYATSGRYSIAYQVVDDRPPSGHDDPPSDVVFVPGFVSNLELHWELPMMADTFRRLGRGRRLLLFDKRGTGLSERVPTDRLPTLEERTADVLAVMDDAGIERAALVGISEGGPLSLLFAATHPDRVSRLALFGTYDHRPLDPVDDLLDRTRRYWGSGSAFVFLAPSIAGDRDLRRAFARFERLSATPEAAAAIVAMANEIDIRSVLASVGQPALIVHRTGDGVFPIRGARALVAGLPDARLVELPGTDHLLFTDPTPVLDAVVGFLAAGDASATPPDRPTVLATLVAVAGADDLAPELVAGVLRQVGVESGPAPAARLPGASVLIADGPARAVRIGQRLLAAPGASGWRVGIHTAEVALVDGRPSGTGVDIAVAVAHHAGAGEVLVTRTVTDLVAGSGLRFEARGAERLTEAPERWELHVPVG